MAKYTSGRQKNLKVGIPSYSEDLTSLEVIGKVGIGTTNATANLQVDGSVILGSNSSDLINIPGSISSNLHPDGDGLYDIGRAPQIGFGANRWKDANFTGKGVFGSGVDAHNIEIGVGTANLIYSTSGNLELNAQSGITNIDDIVTISGNVGIGTANPTSKLWVKGDGYFTGVVTANSFIGDGSQLSGIATSGSISVSISPNIDDVFQYVPYATSFGSTTGFGATTLLVYNPSSGNLGVGTANPTSKLWVKGDGYFTGVVTANSFIGDGSQLTGIVTSGSSSVSISTNTSDANQYVPYASSFGTVLGFGATTALVYNPSTGNLGVGTTNPTSKLQVEGDAFVSGILTATDINSSSDVRLKKNIKKFENTLEKINEINGVSFEWKETDSKSAGVIAQELEKVFPELVINSSEYKKVNYNGLIGVLIESIKELKQEIEDLKRKIDYK